MSEKVASVNNELILTEDFFEKTVVQKQIDESQKRISKQEEESMRTIHENRSLIFEEARQKGYAEGLRAAVEEAKMELRIELQDEFDQANELLLKCNDRLQRMIAETSSIRDHYMESRKDDIIDLALGMAKHIALSAAKVDENVILEAYRENIAQVQYSSREIFVRVHPDSEAIIIKFFGENLPTRVRFLVDLGLFPLDFVIETDREFIDATLESKLKLIEDGVRRVLHDQQGRAN